MVSTPRLSISTHHPSLRVDESALSALVERVCAGEERPIDELSIVLTDHETVRTLNRDYLAHDYDTDVLSFPFSEGPGVDGEVYVDLDTAQERHEEFGASFDQEVARYVVHGVLHLLGYTDKTPASRQLMKAREDDYLRDWPDT